MSAQDDSFHVGICKQGRCINATPENIELHKKMCEGRDGQKCEDGKGVCGPTMLWTALGELAFPDICHYWGSKDPAETTEAPTKEPKARRRRRDRRRRRR